MNRSQTGVILLVLAISVIFSGCADRRSLEVFVTPTVPPQIGVELPPTQRVDPFASRVEAQPSAPERRQIVPTVTWQGPVIGADYRLPPTSPPPAPTRALGSSTSDAGEALFPERMPDLDRAQMGIQFDLNLSQSDWDRVMFRLGEHLPLGWIKVQLSWRDAQPTPGTLESEFFRRTQLYLEDASRRGFNILLSVAKAPAWARSTADADGPPDDPALLAAFLRALLLETGSVVDAIEIWNEPNLIREWTGTLPFDGAGYMQLFRPAYEAIRSVSSDVVIVTAGLAPTGNTGGSVDDRTFMRQMYAAGLGDYRDIVIGAHPYSWANPPEALCCGTDGWDDDPHFFFADNLRDYRQIMGENGHGDRQMWLTEFGWATWEGFPGSPQGTGNDWMLRNSRWDQANYAIRAFAIGQADPSIGVMFLWNLNFALLAGLVENADERVAYGIVVPGTAGQVILGSTDTTERPLYWMLYDAIRPEVNLDTYD